MKTAIITRDALLVCLVCLGSARAPILAGEPFLDSRAAEEFAKYASQAPAASRHAPLRVCSTWSPARSASP